ncbi:MAG TPA: hypothetical protein PKD64_07590 [Pirellulaceae bacterium]|nr:hypothetical protein [Pirellulaceae bacterium]HMO92049.1 hypothetical protein [Pirellulaceae bacterium]HMP68848.1 hypothetical protein [Pirellulaceae bacterium]
MSDQRFSNYRRSIIGVISLALLILAGGLWFAVDQTQDHLSLATGVCVRLGLVLGSIWLAWPQLKRWTHFLPKLLLLGVGFILIIGVVFSRKLLPFALLLVTLVIVLQLAARFLRMFQR